MQKEDTILYTIPDMCDLITFKSIRFGFVGTNSMGIIDLVESGPSCFSSSPGPVKEVEVDMVESVHNISIGKYSNATEISCVNYQHIPLLIASLVPDPNNPMAAQITFSIML